MSEGATKTWRIYATRNLENFMYVDAWERGNIVGEVPVLDGMGEPRLSLKMGRLRRKTYVEMPQSSIF